MKIENSFKLLLLFGLGLALVLLAVYLVFYRLPAGQVVPEAQQSESGEPYPPTPEDKLKALEEARARIAAEDTRTEAEKRADFAAKLASLEEARARIAAEDTRTEAEKRADFAAKLELVAEIRGDWQVDIDNY